MSGTSQRVAHLTSVHPPQDTRITFRECAALAGAGYEVVLVAAGNAERLPPGVRFHGVPAAATRFQRMTRTMLDVYRAALSEDADVYHFHDPELFCVGLLLRARGKRVIFDVHEDIPQDILDKIWIPPIFRRPLSGLSVLALRALHALFSGVVAATPGIAKRFPERKTVVVRNYPELDEFPAPAIDNDFSQRPLSAVYLGAITELRGINEMLAAFASPFMHTRARLTLAGQFESEDLERRVASSPGWDRVDYIGWCSRARVSDVLGKCRVGLVTLRPAANFEDSLPVKLFEYMAAGLPVIISASIRSSEIVRQADCGVVVDPLDTEALARAITFLLENPEIAQAMGERGRRLVLERFQWTNEARKLTDLYRAIA